MYIDISFLVGTSIYVQIEGNTIKTGLDMYGKLYHDKDDTFYVCGYGTCPGDCMSSECWFCNSDVRKVVFDVEAIAPIITVAYK